MSVYRHIHVTRHGDVFGVRLKHARLEEEEIHQLADEISSLVTQEGCRKLLLSLGPETPYCLYSVFLAKLVSLRHLLKNAGGEMALCDVGPNAYSTFLASKLAGEFLFVDTFAAGLAHFAGNN